MSVRLFSPGYGLMLIFIYKNSKKLFASSIAPSEQSTDFRCKSYLPNIHINGASFVHRKLETHVMADLNHYKL